jgi:hypothetical protein
MQIKFYWETLKEKDNLQDLDIGGKLILKLNIKISV